MIEVIIATLIMSLVVATSITAMQRVFPTLDSARCITTAGQLLQNEVEKVRLMDWSTLDALGSGTVTLDSVFTSEASISNRFTVTRTVSSPASDVRQIVFTVTWQAIGGHTVSRSSVTRYAEKGMYDFFYNTN